MARKNCAKENVEIKIKFRIIAPKQSKLHKKQIIQEPNNQLTRENDQIW